MTKTIIEPCIDYHVEAAFNRPHREDYKQDSVTETLERAMRDVTIHAGNILYDIGTSSVHIRIYERVWIGERITSIRRIRDIKVSSEWQKENVA